MNSNRFFDNFRVWLKKYHRLLLLVLTCILILAALFFKFTATPVIVEPEQQEAAQKLKVDAIKIGENVIYTRTIAKAENENELEIAGLSTGYLNKLNIEKGDKVSKGKTVAEVGETYKGNTIYAIQIDLAEKGLDQAKLNKKNVDDAYNDKVALAENQYTEATELLSFNNQTLADLEKQINASQTIIEDIEEIIDDLSDFEDEIDDLPESTDAEEFAKEQAYIQNNSAILGQQQALEQYKATIDQLNQQRQLLEFQTSEDYPGGVINELNRDIYINQLDTEKELAEIAVETAELQLALQKSQATLRSIITPIDGVIEEVYVKEGQVVTAGQPIALLSGDLEMKLIANISSDLVKKLDEDERAIIMLNGEEYKATIEFVSTTTINGNLHELTLKPNSSLAKELVVGSSVEVQIPLKVEESEDNDKLFLPLDSVFKSSSSEYVLILQDGVAVKRDIVTGEIVGDQIFVESGLENGEILIVDRRVIAGQEIELNDPELIEEEEKDKEDEENQDDEEQQNEEEDSEQDEETNEQND